MVQNHTTGGFDWRPDILSGLLIQAQFCQDDHPGYDRVSILSTANALASLQRREQRLVPPEFLYGLLWKLEHCVRECQPVQGQRKGGHRDDADRYQISSTNIITELSRRLL